MHVKCTLCDNVEGIADYSLEAKRLRNRKTNLYLCKSCYDRIGNKTKERHSTGKFHLYKSREKKNSELI